MNRFAIVAPIAAVMSAAVPNAMAQTRSDHLVIPLTDASRPVTLDVTLTAGIIDVTASDTRDVVIDARSPAETGGRIGRGGRGGRDGRAFSRGRARGDGAGDAVGLTRFEQPTALAVEEANNLVSVKGAPGQRIDLTIRVPVRTSFRLTKTAQGSTLGTVTVRGLDGDLEIHTEGGTVTLLNVFGSVVAHSSVGSVIATVTRVTPGRPMAFTSYVGNVDVTLPSSIKADLILRSDHGEVSSDFDLHVTSSASIGAKSADGTFRRPANQPLLATVNGGGPEIELRTFAGNVALRRGK